jgi:hypothetical protein
MNRVGRPGILLASPALATAFTGGCGDGDGAEEEPTFGGLEPEVIAPAANANAIALAAAAAVIAASSAGRGDDEEETPFGIKSKVASPAASGEARAFAPNGRHFLSKHWAGAIRIVTTSVYFFTIPA